MVCLGIGQYEPHLGLHIVAWDTVAIPAGHGQVISTLSCAAEIRNSNSMHTRTNWTAGISK